MAARRRKTRRSRKPGAARRAARAKPERSRSGKPGAARRAASAKPAPRKASRRATASTRKRAEPSPRKRAKAAKPKRPAQPRAKPAARPGADPSAAPHRLVTGAPIEVGVVTHFYPRAEAAVVALSRPIHRGDTIHVRGQTTDFVQPVRELVLEGAAVSEGAPQQQIGVRLEQRARAGDRVFRVSW